MSTHSQFKKFNILQELEQAIKKKTQEKYNPNRSKSRTKPSQNMIKPVPIKSPGADKQPIVAPQSRKVTNQTSKPSKIPEFKIKKHQNKKFDKVISLINYTITSADKALKYVTLSSNFEAEFAFKLYLSDRQNLMNQLNNFNLAEIIGQPSNITYTNAFEMKGFKNQSQSAFMEGNVLRQENDKLKKEIMVLENELKRSQKSQFHQSKSINSPLMLHEPGSSAMIKSRQQVLKRQNDFKQRQIQRISDLLKRVCECSEVYDFLQMLEKDTKYRYILASIGNTGYEVTNKQKQEIQQNISVTEKKLSQIQKEVVRKMNDLMQPPAPPVNQQLVKQYNRLKQMIQKKLLPSLEINSEEGKFSNLSDALTTFITTNSKKQREYKMQAQKYEFELNEIRKRKEEIQQRQLSNQNTISKLNKDNQLVRSNLRQIYQELLSLAFPDQNDSEKTFQQILDHLTDTLQAHQSLLKESQNVIKQTTLLKQQLQSYKSQVNFLKQQNQSLKTEINKKGYSDQAQIQKYITIINNMEEQINSIKNTNNNLQDHKMQIEDLLKNSEMIKRELEQQNMKMKSELSKLRKELATRMEEMREYAGVCSKLQQNYTVAVEENEKMANELSDRKDQLQALRHENVNILDHMRELEQKIKQYENQLNNREEVYENQDRMRVEFNRLNNSYDQLSQTKRQLESEFKYSKLRIEELERQLKGLNASLMKKEEANIQVQMKYEHKIRQTQSKFESILTQNESFKQTIISFQDQRKYFQIQRQELVEHYQNVVSYKNKQIEQLNAFLNGSKKHIEILNIKQQYNTQFKQRSMNELGSQNDLIELSSPQSSNEHSPESVNEKDEYEITNKQKFQQLDEMNQISQIKSSELNEIKELLEQRNIEYESLVENYKELQQHYQEKMRSLQVVNQKYQQYQEKIHNLIDQLHLKDGQVQNLVQEINNLTQQLTQTRMRSANSYANIETMLKEIDEENKSLKNVISAKDNQIFQLRSAVENNNVDNSQQLIILKEQNQNLNQRYSKANNYAKQKQAQLQELNQICIQKDAQIQEQRGKSIYLENTINRLSSECNKKDDLILKMQVEYQQLTKRLDVEKQSQQRVGAYEDSIKELNEKNSYLQEQIYKKEQKQLHLTSQLKDFESAINAKENEVQQANNMVNQLNQRIEIIQSEKRQSEIKYSQLLHQNTANNQELSEKTQHIQHLSQKLAHFQALLVEKQQRISTFENISNERQAELQVLKSQSVNQQQIIYYKSLLDECQEKILYLQGQLSSKEQQIKQLADQQASKQNNAFQQTNSLKIQYQQVRGSLQQSEAQCSALKQELEKVRFVLLQRQLKQQNEQSKLQELVSINNSLKEQIDGLKQYIQRLNSQLQIKVKHSHQAQTISREHNEILKAFEDFRNECAQQKAQTHVKIQNQQEDIQLRTAQLQHLRADMTELERHITLIKQQNRKLQAQNSQLFMENSQLVVKIQLLSTNTQQNAQFLSKKQAQIQLLNEKIAQFQKQIEGKHQFQLTSSQKQAKILEELTELRMRLTESEKIIAQLQQNKEQIQNLSNKLRVVQQQKSISLMKQYQLQKKMQECQREYEVLLAQKQNNAEVISNNLIEDTTFKLESMMKKLQIVQQEYEQNKKQLEYKNMELLQANTRIHQLEEHSHKLKQINVQQAQIISEYSENNQNYQSSVLQYTAKIEQYQSKIQGFEHMLSDNRSISFQLQASTRKNQELVAAYQQLQIIKQQSSQKAISFESENQSLKFKIQQLNLLQTKYEITDYQLQSLKQQNSSLQQKVGQKELQLSELLNQKANQAHHYQENITQLQSKLGQLQNSLVVIKQEKKVLQERISNITSANQINSLKLISKVKQEQEIKEENEISSKKAIYLQKILEDKTQELENVYKLYQNLQEEVYAMSYSRQLQQNGKLSKLQVELQSYTGQLKEKQSIIREKQQLIWQKATEINNLRSQISQKDHQMEQMQSVKDQFSRKQSELLQKQQSLHEQLFKTSKISCNLKQRNIELEMKMEELMLIEIEGYRYKCNMYEITVRNLKNEMQEKDREIRSLRVQKEALYQALQQNIQAKTTQSFGQNYWEVKNQNSLSQSNKQVIQQQFKRNEQKIQFVDKRQDFFVETRTYQISRDIQNQGNTFNYHTTIQNAQFESLTVQQVKQQYYYSSYQQKELSAPQSNQKEPTLQIQQVRNQVQQIVQEPKPQYQENYVSQETNNNKNQNFQEQILLHHSANLYQLEQWQISHSYKTAQRQVTTQKIIEKESWIYVQKEVTENVINNYSQDYFSSEGFSNQFEEKTEKVKIKQYNMEYEASQIKNLGNKKESEYEDINQMRNELKLAQNQQESNMGDSQVQVYQYFVSEEKSSEKSAQIKFASGQDQEFKSSEAQFSQIKEHEEMEKQEGQNNENQVIEEQYLGSIDKVVTQIETEAKLQVRETEKQQIGNVIDQFVGVQYQEVQNKLYREWNQREQREQVQQQLVSQEKVEGEFEIEGNLKQEQIVQNQLENGFDQFVGQQYKEVNNGLYRNKSEQDQVNQVQQIVSQEKIEAEVQNDRKPQQEADEQQFGNDFEQFGELKSQKLGDSILSNRSHHQVETKPANLQLYFESESSTPLISFGQTQTLFNHSQRTQIQTQLGQINQLLKFIPSPRALNTNQLQNENNFKFFSHEQQMIRSSKKSVQSIDSNTQNIFDDFFSNEKVEPSKSQEDLFGFLNFQTNESPYSAQLIPEAKKEVKKQKIDQPFNQNQDLI